MKRIVIAIVFIALLVLLAAPYHHSRAQQRTQMGGRPGEFHFILKDQADHNRVAFRDMQGRIARMRTDIMTASVDDATRARMLQNLDEFSLFVSSMDAQLNTSAGQTAGDVEQRLNYAKGEQACSLCHETATRSH